MNLIKSNNSFRVVYLESSQELRDVSEQWDALWQRSNVANPSARAEQVALWLDHFAKDVPFRAVCIKQDNRFIAALPLVQKKIGKTLKVAGLPCNEWAASGDLLLDLGNKDQGVLDLLVQQINRLPWPILWMDKVAYEEPQWQAFQEALHRQSLVNNLREQFQIGLVDIDQDWDGYFASRCKKHRYNRRYEARLLEKDGGVRLKSYNVDPNKAEKLLLQGFEIEDHSWKHSAGSSVLQSPQALSFYRSQARELAVEGYLRLHFLEHQGRAIAFRYDMQSKGVNFSIKIGYDCAFRKQGPGHQLTMQSLMQHHLQKDAHLVDFVGPLADWQKRWVTRSYPVGRLVVANQSLWSKSLFYLYSRCHSRWRDFASAISLDT